MRKKIRSPQLTGMIESSQWEIKKKSGVFLRFFSEKTKQHTSTDSGCHGDDIDSLQI